MKRSHWLFNCATPDDRYYTQLLLSKCRQCFLQEGVPVHYRMFHNVNARLIYVIRVERVLKRERELQQAHMCAFDPTGVKPEQVVHLDCNILRVWPDVGVEELIKFYTYKRDRMKWFALERWMEDDHDGAHHFKLKRRKYEQALIKLKRECDRRKRVYNLS